MDSQLKALIAERGSVKAKLTLFKKFVETASAADDDLAFERRLKTNEHLYERFDKIQSQIEAIVIGTDNEENHLLERETFEDTYFHTFSRAEKQLFRVRGSQTSTASTAVNATPPITDSFPAARLPVIKLPIFDGDLGQWIRFRDTFTSLVHDSDRLSDIDRFNYLNSSLTGPAARVLESFSVSAANYELAWARLKERYESPKALAEHHINALLDIEAVRRPDGALLSYFIDTATNHVRALESILKPSDLWEAFVISHLSRKIDPLSLDEWEKRSIGTSTRPALREFAKFVEQQSQYLARKESNRTVVSRVTNTNANSRENRGSHAKRHVAVAHLANQTATCLLCKAEHLLQHCPKLLALPFPERHETIKRLGVCFNCLSLGHSIKNCTRGKCRKCGSKHHTALHRDEKPAENDSVEVPTTSTSHLAQSCVSNVASIESTVLSTAIVFVTDNRGRNHKCRALLDVGSQAHFVTERFCKKIGLRYTAAETVIGGIGGVKNPVKSRARLQISSGCGSFTSTLSCLVLNQITEMMPNIPLNNVNIPIPSGVIPADPDFRRPNHIDLLIGAGLFWQLLCVGQHKIGLGNLVWQKTRLGWVLGGGLTFPGEEGRGAKTCHVMSNAQLHDSIARFWEVEEVNRQESSIVDASSDECEKHFRSTTTRTKDGRYVVSIPFNEKISELGESREQAERRLIGLERRFKKNPELHKKYIDFMREYEALGHMTKLDQNSVGNQISYYLPHHAVYKETSTTTKLRVVFDGSAKTSSGISLNDAQLVGVPVQSDLFSILLRFRKHRYVLSADIEKMYRQVLVREEHRRFQRILWRSNINDPIDTYNLNTITYGTASASFLATRVLRQIGEDCIGSHPLIGQAIIHDFYVDDLLTGCETLREAIELKAKLTDVLQGAGMPLQKWASNDPGALGGDHNLVETEFEIAGTKKDPKTLGVCWIVETDELRYSLKPNKANRITKRNILSEIAQIFDPLGLISPIVVRAKFVMKSLWKLDVGWDETLSQELHTQWNNFRIELREISSVVLPRRVVPDSPREMELHGFSDASEQAFGAAIYLRSKTVEGTWSTHLLCAKSRIAPLKTISLPRLELSGALLLARLISNVKTALRIDFVREYHWTDSTIVLAWLRGQPDRWKTFVANRVTEIQNLTRIEGWHHVRSADNPADLVSRGITVSALRDSDLWWHGPQWLSQNCDDWPASVPIASTDVPEERRTVEKHTGLVNTTALDNCNIASRYSSYAKLLRIVAYCYRFFDNARTTQSSRGNCGGPSTPHSPTAKEIRRAEQVVVKITQRLHFHEEMRCLSLNKAIGRGSPLTSLCPFIDDDGLLRVGGRLSNAILDNDRKHPMILPGSGALSTLIVRHEHYRLLHAGPQQTLASLHDRFWIVSGRRLVRGILHKCVTCFKANPSSPGYRMGSLPADRVTPNRPFYTCGVDYAGPFLIRGRGRARASEKTYVCLFVCFVTKATHIELATDMTTDAFLQCLHRFIARRGRCLAIYSDNGRNFIGARNELKELGVLLNSRAHHERVTNSLSREHIAWHLMPPNAPHFGGLWERGVRSVKTHLKRVIGEHKLTYEEFYTILTQIEACLNSRPLHPMSTDPNDLTPLTPGHFLIGDALMALPQPDLTNLNESRVNRYQLLQKAVQHFWKRWHREYLHRLQQRHKWRADSPEPIQTGAMVLLREDNLPPLQWRLGRIIELHPGPDGVTRVVSVRTAHGILKRPVNRICVLPDPEPTNCPPT